MLPHPVAVYASSLGTLVSRARAARLALAVWALLIAVDQLLRMGVPVPGGHPLTMGAAFVHLAVIVLFLLWLHRLIVLTRQLGNPTFGFTPSMAVWSFFIPILNLFRPYQVLCAAQAALGSDTLPEPPLRPADGGAAGYRQMAAAPAPQRRPLPHALLGWWWGFYLVYSVHFRSTYQTLTSRLLVGGTAVCGIVAGIFGIVLITRLTARAQERVRRLEGIPEQTLTEAGIFLG